MAAVPSDPEVQSDVQFPQAAQGAALVVRTGGQINLETGAKLYVAGNDVTNALSNDVSVKGGTIALGGANPTVIATGLTTVTGFSATVQGNSAPGLTTSVLTWEVTGGSVSVYAWEPTSVSNPTLVASTGTQTIGWVATGTI